MGYSYLAALQKKHESMDEKIRAEMSHSAWDETAIKRMKGERLHLRDEIRAMQHREHISS